MTKKLGEHLTHLGKWTQTQWNHRAQQGADGYEHYDLVSALGQNALLGTGTWIGTNHQQGTTASGEAIDIDEGHPLTRIALSGRTKMASLNDLSSAMSGTSNFSPQRYSFLKENLADIGYQVGMKILKHLLSNNE